MESVAGSRPAASAAARSRPTATAGSKPAPARGNQSSQNSTTRFRVWSVSPPSSTGGYGRCSGFGDIQAGSVRTRPPLDPPPPLRPEGLHRQHAFPQQPEAGGMAGAVILHLLYIPAAADAEFE